MLSLLLYLISSKFLSLDVGSAYTKGYVFEDSESPEISLNLLGRRLTPTYIGFRADKQFNLSGEIPISPKEGRLLTAAIGDKAYQYLKHRPWMATGHLFNFIDMLPEKQEQIAARFHVNTSAARLPIHNLISMYFQLIARELLPDQSVTGISVSVPTHFTVIQREIIRNSIKQAGIYCDVICDEATSVATTYTVSRTKSFYNNSKDVLFVDIGASSTKAYVYNFRMKSDAASPEITRKSYAYDENFGGDDVTHNFANYLIEHYNMGNLTTQEYHKLYDVAEKIKIKLSLSQRAEEAFDLRPGVEYNITFLRQDFIKFLKPLRDSVLNVIRLACRHFYPQEVEILGGSSRIPYIADSIREALHIVNHSLNSDEAIAYGTGTVAQQILERSLLRPFIYQNNFSSHSIILNTEDDHFPLVEYGHPLNSNLKFAGIASFIPMQYTYGFPDGIEHRSLFYAISNRKNFQFTTIEFSNEPFDIYSVTGCMSEDDESTCEEIGFSILAKYIQNTTIHGSVMGRYENERRILIARKEIETLASRSLREIKFNMTMKLFSTDFERKDIETIAKDSMTFLNDNQEEYDPEIFEEQLENLKNKTNIVYNRIRENSTISQVMTKLYKLVQVAENYAFLEVPINKSFVGQKNIERIQEKVNETKKKYNEFAEIINKSPMNKDRPVKALDINQIADELIKELDRIRNMKEYKKKEEEKKNSKKGFFTDLFGKIRDKISTDTDFVPEVDIIEDDAL
ncbi:dnaK protein [Trichomonas vaginalis G3]|uniref:DnaK protein n=1 Tax=Trichomonas vaginalis (strain ATCC PRA-98 / G3) TaxID=412133 RepID=A2FNP0_TRIV3|nr:ATP binding [Trichomonas vaginalis G3]EAX93479.1 dnaK protein [Trichomonas vaginalis G3]KAI5535780.1 ATP binding [Trichomonas vaginalis G3]|eukprot:XP_001306409.1 dnaK protein [Trichomonas vaginalis G3]